MSDADRDAYLEALRRGERNAAFRVLDRALDGGAELRDLYLGIVEPAMREVGRLWEQNEISVAEEHVATAITQAAMSRVFERIFHWQDVRTPRLVAACVEDERHQIGLRMLCDLLEVDGWDTTYLGASVPTEDLVAYVRKTEPAAIALSATIAPHVPYVRDAIAAIRAATRAKPPVIAVGGRPFLTDPALAQKVGADLTAGDAWDAVRRLNERVRGGDSRAA